MSEKKWTVVASFEADPGKEAALEAILTSFIEPTLQQEGCLNYDLHRHRDNPAQFLFYENWTTKEALDHHLASPFILEGLKAIKEISTHQPVLTFWEQL